MADILVDAHGSWSPSSEPAYTIVPKGSRLLFFTENMKLFLASPAAARKLASTTPNQVVDALKTTQNYTVAPLGGSRPMSIPGFTYKTPSSETLLCTSDECTENGWHNPSVCDGLFSDPDFEGANIYFAACRYVELKRVGSVDYYIETGVNQRQAQIGDQGDAEVETSISNETADEIIKGLFDDIDDYKDLSADEKNDVHNAILAFGSNDKERAAMERVVARLKSR